MKVSIVHIPYEFSGGEDKHVGIIEEIYSSLGWKVSRSLPGDYVPGRPSLGAALSSLNMSSRPDWRWSESFLEEIRDSDFVHLHNPYPLLGIHFLEWCKSYEKKILWTIHNHRFFCTNGLALRNGEVCLACLESPSFLRPIVNNCNESISKSIYYSSAINGLRRGNYLSIENVELIAPSPYIKERLVKFGIDSTKVHWIPNPIQTDLNSYSELKEDGADLLYCGRLSKEKGIETLLEVSKIMPGLKIFIAGDGPLRGEVISASSQNQNIKYLGLVDSKNVSLQIRQAKIIILPSICNEILPTFLIEGLLQGKKCVASAMESLAWFSSSPFHVTLFSPGKPEDLAKKVREVLSESDSRVDKSKVAEMFSRQNFIKAIRDLVEK